MTININVRIDKDLKEQAELLFEELGINMTTAMTMFLKKTVRDNKIPFDLSLAMPTAETVEAMAESKQMINNPKGYVFVNGKQLIEDIINDRI